MKYELKLYLAGGLGEKFLVFEDKPSDQKGMRVSFLVRMGTNPLKEKETPLGSVTKDDIKRLGRSL